MTFTHFDSIQAYGKKLLVTTSNNRIFFSDNEGESFKEVQNQGRLNFSGSIAFKGDFYVGVRSSRGTGANQVQVLEVHKISSFENQNSSHWKKTLSIDIQSASLSFASDGKYLFAAAGKKLYKSLDGESWSNVSPSSFWGESSDFNFILSSNKGLVVGYSSTKNQKIYSADSNGFWSHAFSHAYTWYNGINTDGTNIYFNDEATGQGLYVTIGSSSTSKKLVEFKHPSRHSFKLFSGNGRYFVASSQGFFSRFW